MISKECFVDLIGYIKKYNDALNELPDWITSDNFPFSQIGAEIIDVLEKEMGLNESSTTEGLICTWCWDYNFGQNYGMVNYVEDENGSVYKLDAPRPGCLVSIDEVKYAPTTAEELYDLIIKVFVNK